MLKWMEDFLSNREMRTIIKDQKSEWCNVKSRIPQGSVLALVILLVYVNYMTEGVNGYMGQFIDHPK